jgi:hypothetical protein
MAHIPSHTVQHAGKAAVNEARRETANPWVQRLERFGYFTRGLIYAIIGVLALQLALGAGGATASPTSAIALIGRQPFGNVLLALVAVGLASYSLWGFVRAIFDPLGRGTSRSGLIDRAGFLVSGISYAVLVIPTVLSLLGKPSGAAQGSVTGMMGSLMAGPWGKWLMIGFGLFWLVAGVGQWMIARDDRFMRDLRTDAMSAQDRQMMLQLGRGGYAARGTVFVLIGLLVFQTTLASGAQQAPSFDGALAALAHAPYGEAILGVVALGLILFGIFSALCMKWIRTGPRRA